LFLKKKEYRENNREHLFLKKKEYRENNRENLRLKNKEYKKSNKEKLRKQRLQPEYKFRRTISHSIGKCIKNAGGNKNNESHIKYMSWTYKEFVKYIESKFESWMNWNNHGVYDPKTWNDSDPKTWKWNLDHIIPQSKLPYDSMDHPNFQKCWALENLRPYSAKQNVIDGNRRDNNKT
jgi:hypothetical protein